MIAATDSMPLPLTLTWRATPVTFTGVRTPRLAAALLTIVFAASIADGLRRMPIQPSDSLELMLQAQHAPSAPRVFTGTLSSAGYMRPLFRAQNKVLFDLADGRAYQAVFRGFHAVLMVALLALFLMAARVRTARDGAAFTFALVVLLGLHTFRGSVQEAYPVNHYLNVLVVCLLTLTLTRATARVWTDVLAAVAFVYAALILETGLLVWVVAVTAWAVGWRGISARGCLVMTALLAGYAHFRFVYYDTGLPTLSERSTGYLLGVLDPPELARRFGERPLWLYGYNVLSSIASVLLSEPRAGRFIAVQSWLAGDLLPRMTLAVVTSFATTALIVASAVRRIRQRAPLDDTARMLVIFVAVLGANAVLSFAYCKDEILMPAGTFYALASYVAVRDLLPRAHGRGPAAVCLVVMLTVLAAGWAVRASSLHFVMRTAAFKQRNEWALLPGEWRREGRWPSDPEAAGLILRLRHEALAMPVPNPRFEPRWLKRVWEE